VSVRDKIKNRYGKKRITNAAEVLRDYNRERNGDAVSIPPELEELFVSSMSQKEHTDLMAANREDVGRLQAVLIAANVLNDKQKRIWAPESDADVDEIIGLDSAFTTALYLAVDKHSEALTDESVKN
jgi:hypothetical protein